jgi:hypothetical protein
MVVVARVCVTREPDLASSRRAANRATFSIQVPLHRSLFSEVTARKPEKRSWDFESNDVPDSGSASPFLFSEATAQK